MPTHSPENPEPFYELAYPGEDQHMRATVTYWWTEDDGHPYDPDAPGEADWESRVVFDEPVDQVDLDTDADRRRVPWPSWPTTSRWTRQTRTSRRSWWRSPSRTVGPTLSAKLV